MSGSLFKAVVLSGIAFGLMGCGPSDSALTVASDPKVRQQEMARLDREIAANPSDGNLYVAKMTLLLAEDSADRQARELWASLYRVQGGPSILVGLVNHPSKNIRKNAICLAGEFRMAEAIKALRRRAEDRNSEVRRVAVKALRQIRDDKSYNLYVLLTKDGDWAVRSEAALALGMFPEADAVRRLSKMVLDSDPYVQYQAAESLIGIAKPQVRTEFIQIFDKATDPLQTSVAGMGLARLGEERGIVATEGVVRRPAHPFRVIAVRVFAEADSQRAGRVFREILSRGETEEDVRVLMKGHVDAIANAALSQGR